MWWTRGTGNTMRATKLITVVDQGHWQHHHGKSIQLVDKGHWQHHACNETHKRGGPGTLATPSQTIDAIGGPGALATPSQI